MASGGSGLLFAGARRTISRWQAQATAAPVVGGSGSRTAVRWESGQWWHKWQRKLRARKERSAGAALAAEKHGGNAGHGSSGEGGKVNEMKMRGRGPFL